MSSTLSISKFHVILLIHQLLIMKDIKLEEVYIYLLERTIRQCKKYSQSALAEIDVKITGDQWVILKRIYEGEGISQREIASLTYKDPASVTRTLDILEKKTLIERKAVNNDRRAYSLYLTKAGKNLVEKITPVAKDVRKKGLKGISPTEQEQFKSLLNKIYDNFS